MAVAFIAAVVLYGPKPAMNAHCFPQPLNIGIFHFSAHPRHVVYLATYVVVMIGTVVILWWDRPETSRAAKPAGLAGIPGPAGTPA